MKFKKITMGSLAALTTIAIPVATVASCGSEEYKTVTLTKKSDLSKVIDMYTMQKKYGFTPSTSIETKTNLQQKQEKVLNHKFVDSLIEEINTVDLTKDHKVVVIDLNALDVNLDKFGDYFWEEMKKIKVDKTKHSNGNIPTIGSSGIIINISKTSFGKKMLSQYHFKNDEIMGVSLPIELSGQDLRNAAGEQLVELLKKLEKTNGIKVINISENGRKYISNNNFFDYTSTTAPGKNDPAIAKYTSINSTLGTYISEELWNELFGKW